ncbi:MAG: type II toxin-antitoxin system VapB family antitoxin [Anaerolineae bacterium]|nr:type II toxin-antitoxin system VapB family antitoxin [Anaerolineae bacterium]
MRTNIVLDQVLVQEALELTGLKTKRAVIEEALRVLTSLKRQERIRELRGQLHWEGDLDTLRTDNSTDDAG